MCVKQKHQQQNCEQYTSQLINLFNIMCQNIASDDDNAESGACSRCFRSSSRSNNNQPSIGGLEDCAVTYLTDTRYNDCVDNIVDASQFYNGQCVAGYCNFVRCIRRINSDLLIANCYAAAAEDNSAELEEDQVTLFKNITSCILATTRCSTINPITGQRQSNRIAVTSYDKWGKPLTTTVPLYNTIQINQAGDLRVVAFPGTTKIAEYFCAYEFNLAQTSWMGFTC
ncbi:uncharacterized protein LOC109596379 isoform X2 [Aethina tumida]|nr:uncharacterized protein LOC109596379 isoform X2 [Aethina tumida]